MVLASPADLADRLGRDLTAAEERQANVFLADATAIIIERFPPVRHHPDSNLEEGLLRHGAPGPAQPGREASGDDRRLLVHGRLVPLDG
ncbi:hypothetical protein [Streptomyces microflavus]|uniref:hypothetical protein n=1 Tax=Streptomyces microflavus TaxID=1919 RepID=UPI003B21A0EC